MMARRPDCLSWQKTTCSWPVSLVNTPIGAHSLVGLVSGYRRGCLPDAQKISAAEGGALREDQLVANSCCPGGSKPRSGVARSVRALELCRLPSGVRAV